MLSDAMCCCLSTLERVVTVDTAEVGSVLAEAFGGAGPGGDGSGGSGSDGDDRLSSNGRNGGANGSRRTGLPACAPGYLVDTWDWLGTELRHALDSLAAVYCLAYRNTLLRLLMSAFGQRTRAVTSIKVWGA
eukprot:28247-Chlamydomonas_euryale.AAC.1